MRAKQRVKPKPLFHVGDEVQFELPGRKVRGVVTEDRGLLGLDGQRVYQIRVQFSTGDPLIYELDENEIEPASNGVK